MIDTFSQLSEPVLFKNTLWFYQLRDSKSLYFFWKVILEDSVLFLSSVSCVQPERCPFFGNKSKPLFLLTLPKESGISFPHWQMWVQTPLCSTLSNCSIKLLFCKASVGTNVALMSLKINVKGSHLHKRLSLKKFIFLVLSQWAGITFSCFFVGQGSYKYTSRYLKNQSLKALFRMQG